MFVVIMDSFVVHVHRKQNTAVRFVTLLKTSTIITTTHKRMHHTIVKTSIIAEAGDDLVHSYASTSK